MEAILRRLGVPEDAIRRGLERGDPEGAILEALVLPGQEERTVSARDVEEMGGLRAEEVIRILGAVGFPPPSADEPILTAAEARVYVELAQLRDVWPLELTEQLARVYGRLLARMARTGAQFLRLYTAPRLRATTETPEERLAATRAAFERLLSLPNPIITGVHQRWLEFELAQTAFDAAEDGGGAALPATEEVTLLFCDLKDFTAYATAEGDVAAVEAIGAFARAVDSERGDDGRVVKALGDGQMLRYPDAAGGVAAGARIMAAMRATGPLHVHASVHRGVVIAREGDYFGGAVNLAARLLAVAGGDQLVATRPVVEEAGEAFSWDPLGVRQIRGVDEPVEVFRLR